MLILIFPIIVTSCGNKQDDPSADAGETYTVSFDANGHSYSPAALMYQKYIPSGLPLLSADGYVFRGWSLDKDKYVFPGTDKNRAMSNNTLIMAYRRMGLSKEITGHGWRATARTLLDEVLEYPPYIIDQQLAHRVKDPNGRAYNRTHHLEQRKKMMQEYADYLDRLANELESKNDLR